MQAEVRQEGSLEDVRKALIGEIERIGKTGVTEEEVERARRKILKAREDESANTRRLAVSLSDWAAQGDWRLYFLYRDRIEQVTPADVQRVAQEFLVRNNRTVGLYIPTEEPQRVSIPSTPGYRGRESVAAGEYFDPTPQNVEQRTERITIGEGLQVALLPKKTKGEVVELSLNLRYGNATNLQGLVTACDILPSLMTRGTEQLSHQQLRDELDKNRSTLRSGGSLGSASFSLQSKRPNLPSKLSKGRSAMRESCLFLGSRQGVLVDRRRCGLASS